MSNDPIKTLRVGQAWRVILRDLGLDELAILRRAGQPPTLLDGEGSRISLDDYYALYHYCGKSGRGANRKDAKGAKAAAVLGKHRRAPQDAR